MQNRKSATLLEVARLAGVSTATVNRAIKQQGYVSPEARDKVMAAVEATNYRPNVIAAGLRTNKTFTIGLVLTAITVNPFFVGVAHAVELAAMAAGYRTVIFNHGGSAEQERRGVENFIAQRVDAVLFCTTVDSHNIELLNRSGIPTIEIERSLSMGSGFVRVDNYVGARQAIDHLVALGHQRIAFVGGDPTRHQHDARRGRSVEDDRLAAYHDGMAAHGLPIVGELIRLGAYYDLAGEETGLEGREHGEALMDVAEPPTAIFATCDILAAGIMQTLYRSGRRIPQDVSVIGFDDTLASYMAPELTTVAQPISDLGTHAFRLALAAIDGKTIEEDIVLPSVLTVRRSTSPLPL